MLQHILISCHHSGQRIDLLEIFLGNLCGHVWAEFDDALAVAGDNELLRRLSVVALLPLDVSEDQVVAVVETVGDFHVHVAVRPLLLLLNDFHRCLVGAELDQLQDAR